jgi:hypothetical protein
MPFVPFEWCRVEFKATRFDEALVAAPLYCGDSVMVISAHVHLLFLVLGKNCGFLYAIKVL